MPPVRLTTGGVQKHRGVPCLQFLAPRPIRTEGLGLRGFRGRHFQFSKSGQDSPGIVSVGCSKVLGGPMLPSSSLSDSKEEDSSCSQYESSWLPYRMPCCPFPGCSFSYCCSSRNSSYSYLGDSGSLSSSYVGGKVSSLKGTSYPVTVCLRYSAVTFPSRGLSGKWETSREGYRLSFTKFHKAKVSTGKSQGS